MNLFANVAMGIKSGLGRESLKMRIFRGCQLSGIKE